MKCRHCSAQLIDRFLDLGFAPPSNAYLRPEALRCPETHYPLRVFVCSDCRLVQTEDFVGVDEIFSADYAYFSSTSADWLAHARAYCRGVIPELGLNAGSFVVEVASNDGYLLRNFVEAGIPCLGIEPTESTASVAEAAGIPVLREFFGEALADRVASERGRADLIIGNNVYAHVPDINGFTRGLGRLLKPGGTITLEFPHLLRLIEGLQFDTIYHEHYSYLSLASVSSIFASCGLDVHHVEELQTHGGSLRIHGGHAGDHATRPSVGRVMEAERRFGLKGSEVYAAFQANVEAVKDGLLRFLLDQKRERRIVGAYGAAAKGNTLLNFAGVRPDLLGFVCDAAPSKQGKFLPASHIPILPPEALRERKPGVVLILPWNIADEVARSHAYIAQWGGRFVVAVPEIRWL